MKLILIAVGSKMPAWVQSGYDEYSRRFPRDMPLELIEIAAGKRGKNADIKRILELEGEKMLAAVPKGSRIVTLEVTGANWSSPMLAGKLTEWQRDGRDVCLLVGGPEGLAQVEPGAELKGTLRITTTVEFALAQVVAALQVFREQHPQLNIHLSTSSTHADLISERFDVALRLGRMDDSNLRAVQLSTFDIHAVAAPALLAQHPPVSTLTHLQALPTLGHGRVPELTVKDPEGIEHVYQPQPGKTAIIADNSATLQAFALSGQGVAILPEWLVADDLKSATLLRLLPDHRFARQGVYALYPDTRHLPLKVRAFIDFMKGWGAS